MSLTLVTVMTNELLQLSKQNLAWRQTTNIL